MNENFISRLVEALILANVIQPFDKQRAMDVAREKLQNEIHIIWNIEDVIEQAKQDGVEMDEEKARQVLATVEHRHDCTIGVTWDAISAAIAENME